MSARTPGPWRVLGGLPFYERDPYTLTDAASTVEVLNILEARSDERATLAEALHDAISLYASTKGANGQMIAKFRAALKGE